MEYSHRTRMLASWHSTSTHTKHKCCLYLRYDTYAENNSSGMVVHYCVRQEQEQVSRSKHYLGRISHRQVKHKDETLRQTADRQMQPSIVAGFFNLHLASLGGLWPHSTDTTTATYWPEVLKIVTLWLTKIPKHLSWRLQNPQTHVPGDMEVLV